MQKIKSQSTQFQWTVEDKRALHVVLQGIYRRLDRIEYEQRLNEGVRSVQQSRPETSG